MGEALDNSRNLGMVRGMLAVAASFRGRLYGEHLARQPRLIGCTGCDQQVIVGWVGEGRPGSGASAEEAEAPA